MAKLDQEPTSHSLAGRLALERIRDIPAPAARPWPTVQADDEFAVHQALEDDDEDAQHGGGHVFVVGLLAIGYDIEEVYLYLQASSTLDELCTQISYPPGSGPEPGSTVAPCG